jgi:hypothetical protein
LVRRYFETGEVPRVEGGVECESDVKPFDGGFGMRRDVDGVGEEEEEVRAALEELAARRWEGGWLG